MEIGVDAGELRALIALLRRASTAESPLSMRMRADLGVHANLLSSLLGTPAPSVQQTGEANAAATELPGWAGADARRPNGPDGLQHAVVTSGRTACGLPARAITVWQHAFHAGRVDACPDCVAALAKGAGHAAPQ